ncbi:hypothetical protein [Pseudomonas viridiflava]|uniref:hypothetical protein n=1 Tax=Pseudomonas viridiflava TaxID=33069 RepID=UPI000F075EBA|nr:hypothetical protein [Pseudomonas viridiflava]
MTIQADFPDLAELKRLADACPSAGFLHFESEEFKAVKDFTDEVIRLFETDVGMAKALIAEIETLREDAARYQWIRDKSEAVHSFYLSVPIWFSSVRFRKEDVDSYIDAAIAEQERS